MKNKIYYRGGVPCILELIDEYSPRFFKPINMNKNLIWDNGYRGFIDPEFHSWEAGGDYVWKYDKKHKKWWSRFQKDDAYEVAPKASPGYSVSRVLKWLRRG